MVKGIDVTAKAGAADKRKHKPINERPT